jgi:hypothetical protein
MLVGAVIAISAFLCLLNAVSTTARDQHDADDDVLRMLQEQTEGQL